MALFNFGFGAEIDGPGTDGNDEIHGGEGNDYILGLGGNDLIRGHGGHDYLAGDGGDLVDGGDWLDGGAGNDLLRGGAGFDYIDGGTGTDTVDYRNYGNSSYWVTVNLGTGFATVRNAHNGPEWQEVDTLVSIEDAIGTAGGDVFYGNAGSNGLFGQNGSDYFTGGGGADYIHGGAGARDQAIYRDSSVGVTVNLATGVGFGGTAEGDVLVEIEDLAGSEYDDNLLGNDGVNWLFGRAGNDLMKGAGGDDRLSGDAGADTLKGGGGADVLHGGAGGDTAAYNDSPAAVFVSLFHNVAFNGDADGDTFASIENVTGSTYDDDLWGDDGPNLLAGMDGNDALKGYGGHDRLNGGYGTDTLHGMGGDDTLDGGAGADTMIGSTGGDRYFVDNAGDVITEYGGEGSDVVYTSVSYTLTAGADVEFMATANSAGTEAIDLTGNSSGNVLYGNEGTNVINGGGGNDQLFGLGGLDRYLFDTALDAVTNVDEIPNFGVAADTIVLENTIFGAFAAGPLAAERFIVGTVALEANDNVIYDSTTGALLYDSDGNGAGAAVQFAELAPGLALTENDFLIV